VKQVCQRLTIGRTTLEGLFKSGKLTKVVIGPKAIRVDPDELDRFVASVSQVGTSVESAVAVAFDADAQFDTSDSPFA